MKNRAELNDSLEVESLNKNLIIERTWMRGKGLYNLAGKQR